MKKRSAIFVMLLLITLMPFLSVVTPARAEQMLITSTPESAPNLDSASDWARGLIVSAINKGFVPEELQSDYQNVITRQEFCRMSMVFIEYATGKSIDEILSDRGLSIQPNAFSDTDEPYIVAAFALGITTGTTAPTDIAPGLFTPDGQLRREEAATMIIRVCRVIGMDTTIPTASGFTDIDSVPSWALDGISFCYINAIMGDTQTPERLFSPKATFTREESIAAVLRVSEFAESPDWTKPDYQGMDGGFAPGPVVYLDGYTYYAETAIAENTEIPSSTTGLERLCRVADGEGSEPEVVYTSVNYAKRPADHLWSSSLTLFLWRGEVWFFDLADMSNEDELSWMGFTLYRLDKDSGEAVEIPLDEKDGRFIELLGMGNYTTFLRDHSIHSINAIGADGEVLFCSVNIFEASNSAYGTYGHAYTIAVNILTGEVMHIDKDLHNGEPVFSIGVYEGRIYYLRMQSERVLVCGQAVQMELTVGNEETHTITSAREVEYFSSEGLRDILVFGDSSYTLLRCVPMKNGEFYFLSYYSSPTDYSTKRNIQVLKFDAKDDSLSVAANTGDVNTTGGRVAAAGNAVFFSVSEQPNSFLIKKYNLETGELKDLLENAAGRYTVFGATERYLYYIDLNQAGFHAVLCRIDYTKDGAAPEMLRSVVWR